MPGPDENAEEQPAPQGHNGPPEDTVESLREQLAQMEDAVKTLSDQVIDANDSVVAVQHRNQKLEQDATGAFKGQVRLNREIDALKKQLEERDGQIRLLQSRGKADPGAAASAVALTAADAKPPPPGDDPILQNRGARRAAAAKA